MASKFSLIFKSSGFRVLQSVVSMIIGLLMMPFLITTLGQEHYGLWIVIGSVVGTYYLLDLGFSQAVTRYVSKYIHQNNPAAANRIINTALVIYALLGLLILLISVIAAHYGAEKLMDDKSDIDLVILLLMISGLSLALEFPAKAFPGIISAYMRYDFIALVRLGKSIVTAVLIYIFLSRGYGLVAMSVITLVTGLIGTVIYIRFTTSLFKSLEFKRSYVEWSTLKDVFHFSKWVFVMDMNTMLREKMDIWFIAFLQSSGVLTVYYVAVRLVEYAVTFLTQATGFSTPIFTEYHAKNENEKLILSINLFIKVNFLLGFVFIAGFSLMGYSFIRLWMGDTFPVMEAYLCLLLITVGRFSSYFSAHFQSLLMTLNRHSISAWVSLAESFVMAILLMVLVPRYSILGASIAVSVPIFIGRLIFIPIYTSRFIDFSLAKIMVRVIMVGTLSLALWYMIYDSFPYLRTLGWLELIAWAPVIAAGQLLIGFALFNKIEFHVIREEVSKRIGKHKHA